MVLLPTLTLHEGIVPQQESGLTGNEMPIGREPTCDKDDKNAYWSMILVAWGVQFGIITLIFLLILFAIHLKDRV